MPIKKSQSQLFLDWPANMGFEVPYIDSMEGMSTNDLNYFRMSITIIIV
jgi:hypothetical protein